MTTEGVRGVPLREDGLRGAPARTLANSPTHTYIRKHTSLQEGEGVPEKGVFCAGGIAPVGSFGNPSWTIMQREDRYGWGWGFPY